MLESLAKRAKLCNILDVSDWRGYKFLLYAQTPTHLELHGWATLTMLHSGIWKFTTSIRISKLPYLFDRPTIPKFMNRIYAARYEIFWKLWGNKLIFKSQIIN